MLQHRRKGVGNCNDASAKRYVCPLQFIRVACAVKSFVMVKDDLRHAAGFSKGLYRSNNCGTNAGMLAHHEPLCCVQCTRFFENRVRDADFADVMQMASEMDFLNGCSIEA